MNHRPEPCILFAQTFVHSKLDEHFDEVLFAEPIVISACEFLEQNATPSTPSISLTGATSPPSFAMEVFVHCEGESRFRRLCQPFLYSHSSSNILEVEAIVTTRLVVRGSYRSLTLIVYGNTAEDLGQFNIEFDLDNTHVSLLPSSIDGKLEDLPAALLPNKLTFEEYLLSTKHISLPIANLDLSFEMKQFIRLIFNILQSCDDMEIVQKVARIVITVVCSHITGDNHDTISSKNDSHKNISTLSECRTELFQLYKSFQETDCNEHDADSVNSEILVDMLFQCFPFFSRGATSSLHNSVESKVLILGLNLVVLLCSAKESCSYFVNHGGLEQIAAMLGHLSLQSPAYILVLLGAIEKATQHAIGCEGFLGRLDKDVPKFNSIGYSNLLKLLLTRQRHDVASHATYILHRLQFYDSVTRYESAVFSALANPSAEIQPATEIDYLLSAASQIKKIMKILGTTGPIEDPSPAASARKCVNPIISEGVLSYKATANHISSSKHNISRYDIDAHLLSLLMERGFLPLSAALLSSPALYSIDGIITDVLIDIATSIQSLLMSLLSCRSGLIFLLLHPEATAALVYSLKGTEDRSITECLSLRQAVVLMSKGFFCYPQEIGMIIETHLRVGNAIDRLLTASPQSEELLWILWDIRSVSRSECGREALLSLCYFPEALSVLLEALRSFKDLEKISTDDGTSPLSLATFHTAAEIFEVIVTDSCASSLNSWIGHAVELHKALHLSSPGSNRKDAPTRLLEWIDAGVVYHKNGATGLLRYTAVLASGGDAHLNSTRVLVSESMDVETVVGDSNNALDAQILDSLLGKLICDKYFDGITLSSSSIVQLTTAIRILAFISENSAMAASLFEEGALSLVYTVLINCKYMLEQSFSTYDFLVDEGAESNSTTELLLERVHEQNLLDLMIPTLVLLINLLRKLNEAKPKEPYRNKKLVNALLRLHRELSPKVAACATDYSSSYPSLVLGYGAACQLITSALAYWAVFNWTPGLFHCLLGNSQTNSSLALGPKEACSILHLLGDLFPEEGIWLWKDGMPPLCALRTLCIGTVLGPETVGYIGWYLQPEHSKMLLVRLTSQLSRIANMVLNFSFSTMVVIQDMLRVLIVRIASKRLESADMLVRPLILWIKNRMNESSLSDLNSFKMSRLLNFLANLLKHPCAKTSLLKAGATGALLSTLKRYNSMYDMDGKFVENRPDTDIALVRSWGFPVFKSLALIFESYASVQYSLKYEKYSSNELSIEVCTVIGRQLLKSCEVLPVGKELLASLLALKDFTLSTQGKAALLSIFSEFKVSVASHRANEAKNCEDFDWQRMPPFLCCWRKLYKCLNIKDDISKDVIDAIYALTLCALCLCLRNEGFQGISMVKCLFGLPYDTTNADVSLNEALKDLCELKTVLDNKNSHDTLSPTENIPSNQVKESVKSLILILQEDHTSHSPPEYLTAILPLAEDETSFSHFWNSKENSESNITFPFNALSDKFMWECPDTPSDKLLMAAPPGKRKMQPAEVPGKRARESPAPEAVGSNAFSSRRDTFRQRKPNTSRPPSMHVDDYVARESSGPHMIGSSQRVGLTGGRPPSVHVDEFEARQRERHTPTFVTAGSTSQLKPSVQESQTSLEKSERPQKTKADLIDDLQEIDIVFDEESESDDKLPFPHTDETLQSAPFIGENSPRSVVEETEGNSNTNEDANEVNIPLEKPLLIPKSEELNFISPSVQHIVQPTYHNSSQNAGKSLVGTGSQGFYDHKFSNSLPPLPPTPPPSLPVISPQISDPMPSLSPNYIQRETQHQSPFPLQPFRTFNGGGGGMGFQHQADTSNSMGNGSLLPNTNNQHFFDKKFTWNSDSPSTSSQPLPPLPPMPPPFAALMNQSSQPSTSINDSQISFFPTSAANLNNSFSVPSFPQQMLLGRGQIQSNISPSMPSPQPQLPPPPPSLPRSQNLGNYFPMPQSQFDQIIPMQQNQVQVQMQPMQMQQPQMQLLYQANQQQQAQQSVESINTTQQQNDELSLQQILSSNESIQTLLDDRTKLCELLEKHPKLMQMLEAKLH